MVKDGGALFSPKTSCVLLCRCGGGAYELISLFGGRQTPTAGFALGFDRTILALEIENKIFEKPGLDIYIIPINKEMIEPALKIAQMLRSKEISVDIDLMRRGIGKSLKYASSLNSKKAIILGPDEFDKNSVTLRNMITGDQKIISIDEL